MMIDDDWISDSQTSIHQKITQNPLNPFTDDFPEKNLHFVRDFFAVLPGTALYGRDGDVAETF